MQDSADRAYDGPMADDSPGLRERKNARTRDAIERAAAELALEQGFDHTTVDQIADRAEVAPLNGVRASPDQGVDSCSAKATACPSVHGSEGRMAILVDRLPAFVQAQGRGRRRECRPATLKTRAAWT